MNDSNPPTPSASPVSPYGPIFFMTFGQILDRIFRLMRSHWKTFTAIGILPMGVAFVFYAAFFAALFLAGVFKHSPAQPNTALILETVLPLSLLFIPVMLILYGLFYGASTYATLRADHDFTVAAGEALRHAWSRIGRYVWLMVLRSLIIAIPIFALAIAIAIGALLLGLIHQGATLNPAALFFLVPLIVLFYLGVIVYAIFMSLRLSLAFAASVQEDITAWQAIKRSGKLTHGAKGRIFLVLLIIYVIGYAVAMVLYFVGFFVFAIGALATGGHINWTSPATITLAALAGIVVLALIVVWTALLLAAYSTAFAVFYRDQRLRKEGPPPMPGPITELA
jgi:MFS family permease